MATKSKLTELCRAFADKKRVADELKKDLDELKSAIRAEARGLRARLFKGGDQSATHEGVIITMSDEDPPPPLDALRFAENVGRDLFFELVTEVKAKVDVDRFRLALEREQVTERDLMDALGEAPAPQAWKIGLARGGAKRS